jgi:serine protease Do
MRKSILAILLVPMFLTVAYGAQLCSQEPFSESFGFSSEDFGGGAYLGVDTRDITPDRLSDLKLKEEHGVEVTLVDQDAPAGKAGLKEHDVILNLNGNQVESVEQLRRMIREIPPGRVVTLGISRDGQSMTIKAQLADRKNTFAMGPQGKPFKFVAPMIPSMPPMPDIDVPVSIVVVHSSTRSGLMVENLTPQLAEFFGAKNGQGVLVRSVDKGSRADKAGFRAGDVIVKINGEPIHDSGDFTHAIHGRKADSVNVGIIRDKKEQTLTLSLPERKQSEFFDESFDIPDINAEMDIDLSQVREEMTRIKPELERAAREVRMETAGIERLKPELEKAADELCRHKEEFQKEMRELQEELKHEFPQGSAEF